MRAQDPQALFDLKARQLSWRLSANLLHFNDGLNVLHFVRTTLDPFQVITWHVGEIPPQWMTDHGRYECFRAGLSIIASSPEVRDELTGKKRTRAEYAALRERKVDYPTATPSWWVE